MKKIIIIEDDVDTIDILEIILRDNGYAVIKANRQVPIKEIIAIAPSLAIVDVRLPFGSGDHLCLEIKSHPKTKNIPVILSSASDNLKKIAISCHADTYIEKPFDVDSLLKTVNETIS
ncbi:MAG TPA: response regulator [Mucilaginibacter sp.]|nr:response regulator [Mucilaginibacter sp.]